MPKISVVIPVYNVEKFLPRCLDSVLSQTFDDFEVICVNDGSPDNSEKILKQYENKDKRIKVFKKENGGLSDARNFGISKARGDYIFFLDSDDFIHKQTLEITYYLAQKNRTDIVSFRKYTGLRTKLLIKQKLGMDINNVRPSNINKIYDLNKIRYKNINDAIAYCTERSHRKKYWQIKHCYVWRNLYKRELIKDIPFIKGIIMEDLPWWLSVLLKKPSITITKLPLYYYIPNLNSILASTKNLTIIKDIATGLKDGFKKYEKASLYEFELWNREFLWPFMFHIFRKIEELDVEDTKKAKSIFLGLMKDGILDNKSSQRAHKYYKRVIDFVS